MSIRYDWVVLGSHPAALLSGCLAARMGLSVLIVPVGAVASSWQEQNGQVIDPETNFQIGMGRFENLNGLLRECIHHLGVSPSEAALIASEQVLPQVLTPNCRAYLHSELEPFTRELKREFGESEVDDYGLLQALSFAESTSVRFWKGFPERLTLSPSETQKNKFQKDGGPISRVKNRRQNGKYGLSGYKLTTLEDLNKKLRRGITGPQSAKNWFHSDLRLSSVSRRKSDPPFLEWCLGLWNSFSTLEDENPKLSQVLHLMALGKTGAAFQGGMTAYRKFLLKLAKRLGCHLAEKGDCRRIFIEEGRFVGVHIASERAVISASGAIVGTSIEDIKSLISVSGRSLFYRLRKTPKPKAWKYTLGLTIHSEAVPPGATRWSVWQEAGAPALEIELASPTDYGVQHKGKSFVFLRTRLPYTAESLDSSYQKKICLRMLKQLSDIFPFVEYHGAEFLEQESSQKLFNKLDEIPDSLKIYEGSGIGSRVGYEGLFSASNQSYPELGTLGSTVAALEATAWLAHLNGLMGPFG